MTDLRIGSFRVPRVAGQDYTNSATFSWAMVLGRGMGWSPVYVSYRSSESSASAFTYATYSQETVAEQGSWETLKRSSHVLTPCPSPSKPFVWPKKGLSFPLPVTEERRDYTLQEMYTDSPIPVAELLYFVIRGLASVIWKRWLSVKVVAMVEATNFAQLVVYHTK